ncbi:MAG: LptA/OstA family protein [Rectinema sp.]
MSFGSVGVGGGARRGVQRAALALVLGLSVAVGAYAQTAAEGVKDTISFSAKRVESVLAKGKEKTILVGQARVLTGSMEIKADRIELTGTDYRNVACTGSVSVIDTEKEFSLVSATLVYDRETEIGLAEGKVELDDSKNGVILDAEWVQFDQKESLVEARNSVHILKEDFAVRAEFATFNRNDESLALTGVPVAATGSGTIQADKITGAAGADSLEFSGQVSGTITTKKKEGTAP